MERKKTVKFSFYLSGNLRELEFFRDKNNDYFDEVIIPPYFLDENQNLFAFGTSEHKNYIEKVFNCLNGGKIEVNLSLNFLYLKDSVVLYLFDVLKEFPGISGVFLSNFIAAERVRSLFGEKKINFEKPKMLNNPMDLFYLHERVKPDFIIADFDFFNNKFSFEYSKKLNIKMKYIFPSFCLPDCPLDMLCGIQRSLLPYHDFSSGWSLQKIKSFCTKYEVNFDNQVQIFNEYGDEFESIIVNYNNNLTVDESVKIISALNKKDIKKVTLLFHNYKNNIIPYYNKKENSFLLKQSGSGSGDFENTIFFLDDYSERDATEFFYPLLTLSERQSSLLYKLFEVVRRSPSFNLISSFSTREKVNLKLRFKDYTFWLVLESEQGEEKKTVENETFKISINFLKKYPEKIQNAIIKKVRNLLERLSKTGSSNIKNRISTYIIDYFKNLNLSFSIPLNYDLKLIEELLPFKSIIYEFYGGLPTSIFPSLRISSERTVKLFEQNFVKILDLLNKNRINFNLILNSFEYRQNDLKILSSFIMEYGLKHVTTSNLLLGLDLKEMIPDLEITASIASNIYTVQKANYWKTLAGVKKVVVPKALNNDFFMLKKLKNAGFFVKIVVADFCIPSCPFFDHHSAVLSFGSKKEERFVLDKCRNEKEKNLWLLYQDEPSPADLKHLASYVDLIKIAGRDSTTSTIVDMFFTYLDFYKTSNYFLIKDKNFNFFNFFKNCDKQCLFCLKCKNYMTNN